MIVFGLDTTWEGEGLRLSIFDMQTIQDYGGGIPTTTKRGQGLS